MLALNRQFQNAIWQSNLAASPSTAWGTRLTAHANPHEKGTYATLMTTTYDVYGFWLAAGGTNAAGTQTDMLLDIAIGGSQETVIVPEFLCGWRNTPNAAISPIYFPIFIPKGTLVSGRIQALITADTCDVLMFANGGASAMPGPLFSGCDAYGTSTAASQGTSHTPGNSGAESVAANIGSTTSKHYGAVMLGIGGTLADTNAGTAQYHWELQIGGGTICEWWSNMNGGEFTLGPIPPAPFQVSIPSGTQLQVRAECSGTAEAQDVAFYCFY
jgi:hypothetical protein